MSTAQLLLDLGRLGIRLEADGERLRYYPRSALPPDLLDRLKAHKPALMAMLQPVPQVAPVATGFAPAKPTRPVCRCGSAILRDVPIHGGQSVRRDCGNCGRFLDFPAWYGKDALHYEQ